MNASQKFPAKGRCSCGEAEYVLSHAPIFVHCCHCTWCQRETGSAFAVNALIEAWSVELLKGDTETIEMPSNSGAGQKIIRCSVCKSALWSHYGAAKDKVAFIRVGTLNDPNLCPPDIHIYTTSKQNWVQLPHGVAAVDEYYRRSLYWPESSVNRYKKAVQNKR